MFAVDFPIRAGQACSLHTHACTEIVWYRGCRGRLPLGDALEPYEDGDISVYQPWLRHGDESETAGNQVCVGLRGGRAEEIPPGVWKPDPSARAALASIHAVLDTYDDWRQQRLDILGSWLILELHRQKAGAPRHGGEEPYHVAAARRILDTRFAEPLSISGLAQELSISADYLRQLFVHWVGEPPVRYLIRKRLEAACDLLRLNQESVATVAERVGISNPYYFSRLFRQRMGMTPSRYRAQYAGGMKRTASQAMEHGRSLWGLSPASPVAAHTGGTPPCLCRV